MLSTGLAHREFSRNVNHYLEISVPISPHLPVYSWAYHYEANENVETINSPWMLELSIITKVIQNEPKLWKIKDLNNSRFFLCCIWSLHMFDHRWLSISGKAWTVKLQSRYSQILQCLSQMMDWLYETCVSERGEGISTLTGPITILSPFFHRWG